MTDRAVIAGATVVIVELILACSQPTPTQPGKVPTPVPTAPVPPGVFSLKITSPAAIAPGQTVQFTATGLVSNGTTEDDTRKVIWTASPTSVLAITRDTGEATGLAAGDVTVRAAFSSPCCDAQVMLTVLPTNTYRLTGKVRESGLPVQGAAITVLSGVGSGLAATTDDDGSYRLYGVAGTIQVKFSKAGYDDIVKTFTATQNDVLDFSEAHQSAAIPSLAGTYTLTLTADPTCPTSPVSGIAALPDEFRQPRNYAASVTQNGPSLGVTLTDPGLVTGLNQFWGRVEPDAIVFEIASNYYSPYVGIAEQLSSGKVFVFRGQVNAQRSGSAIVGRLDGALEVFTPPSGAVSAQCMASNNPVTLTPAAQPSRHR